MPSGYTLPARRFLRFSQNRSAIRAWKIYSTHEILGLFYNGSTYRLSALGQGRL